MAQKDVMITRAAQNTVTGCTDLLWEQSIELSKYARQMSEAADAENWALVNALQDEAAGLHHRMTDLLYGIRGAAKAML